MADLPELSVARQEERIQFIAPQAQFQVPHNAELVRNDGLRMGVQKRPHERMTTSRKTNEAERFHFIEQAAVATPSIVDWTITSAICIAPTGSDKPIGPGRLISTFHGARLDGCLETP